MNGHKQHRTEVENKGLLMVLWLLAPERDGGQHAALRWTSLGLQLAVTGNTNKGANFPASFYGIKKIQNISISDLS